MFAKIKQYLPRFIKVTFNLFLLEFVLLSLCRLVFYYKFKTIDVEHFDATVILEAFRMGISFDLVASTYALLLPFLLLLLNDLFARKTKAFNQMAFVSALIIFCLYAFISMADFPYFKQFGTHLNKQAFLWAASPSYVFKLIIGDFSYYSYFFAFLLLAYSLYKLIRLIVLRPATAEEKNVKPIWIFLSLILFVPFLIFGARGRLSSKSTTHEGMAIVSDNLFVNQIALNPNFTMFRSLLFQKIKPYKIPDDVGRSLAFARAYLGLEGNFEKSITRKVKVDSVFRPYNIIVVCMESMSMYKTGIHGRENLTPNLNQLSKESVLFDRFFSSGIHTFNGLFSTVSGFPGMLTEHALRRYTKRPFSTLGNLLLKKNYQTYLAVTHDPVFDNMEGFFKLNGYNQVISSNDLPRNKSIGVTGVPDHELYHLLISKLNASGKAQPFLAFVMTGSDHGPWLIPEDIAFKPTAETKEKRSTQYADWAIGEFMKEAKKQSWYDNTLFVFLGDHGYSIEGTYEMPLSYHHVPLILHKPNTLKPSINHHLGYQPDVLSTVAGVLNLDYENSTFGMNILNERHPFVYFTADDKIGCVSDDGYFFYELMTQKTKRLRKYMELDQKDYYSLNKAKADSLETSAKKMLDAAEFIIRRDYFAY